MVEIAGGTSDLSSMKPANFPERLNQRRIRALERLSDANPEATILRGRIMRDARSLHSKKQREKQKT